MQAYLNYIDDTLLHISIRITFKNYAIQRYEVSPDGRLIALCGRAGEIYLLTSSTKELIGTLNMNTKCRTVSFTPDNKKLITHGGKL